MSSESTQRLDTEAELNSVYGGLNRWGALSLAFNNIENFLQYARDKATEGADFVKVNVSGVGKCVFTNTPEAAEAIFKAYSKTRPAKFAGLVTRVFGGNGILTTTYSTERKTHPLAKLAGAEGVKQEFSPAKMKLEGFKKTINKRSSELVDKLSNPQNTQRMDEIIQDMRLDYLGELYLSFTSDEEIQEFHNIWKYTEAVFGNVFMLTIMDMMPFVNQENLLNIPIFTQHIGKMKEKADATLLREINKRFELPDDKMPYDLLSQMIITTKKELFERKIDFSSLDPIALGEIKADLISNFDQVFFASLETSKAGILSTHMGLSNSENHNKFLELQKVVDQFVNEKGECTVSFGDLQGENPTLGPIIEYALTTMVEKVITPITNREIDGEFKFKNKAGELEALEDGDMVFMDVGHISKIQLQRMIANGEPLNNMKAATSLLIFGDGLSKCKGAQWAVYEVVTQLVHTLHKAKSINVSSAKYRRATTNTYHDVDVKIEQRVA